jgi:hypothetical protein
MLLLFHSLVLFTFFSLSLILPAKCTHHVDAVIEERLTLLKKVARAGKVSQKVCSKNDFLVFEPEYAYGNTGNIIISLTHSLWLAGKLNVTVVLAPWIEDSISHFDLSVLAQDHCFTLQRELPPGATKLVTSAEDSFYGYRWFSGGPYKEKLPPADEATIRDISKLFIRVYAALWSSPKDYILNPAKWIIQNSLQGGFGFVAVHKRSLEGQCTGILNRNTQLSEFSPKELPMESPEWAAENLKRAHPLCDMSLNFVNRTIHLYRQQQQQEGAQAAKIFVAYDGSGDVSDYMAHGEVLSVALQEELSRLFGKTHLKYIDMLVAMHGSLFLQNPRSTFSWQVFLVRLALGLPSVPLLQHNDFYLGKLPQDLAEQHRPVWVSWSSASAAMQEDLAARSAAA